MKKSILLMLALLSFTTVLSGCGSDRAEEEQVQPEPKPEPAVKKGAAFSKNTLSWSDNVADLKAHWNYNWGLDTITEQQPSAVEFVPMKWGGSLTNEQVTQLAQDYADGKFKYLLGFNEPDGAEQANMSVDTAIANWSQLEAVGAPLVSPAPVGVNNDWMDEFMTKAQAQGLKIDYIAMHSYGGASASALLARIDGVYAKWGIPIWLTEFAVADWTADTKDANKYTPAKVLTFMQEILPALDSHTHVFRYSWFSVTKNATGYYPLWPSALFDDNGDITPLGQFYADHTPNTNAGPGKTPDVIADDPDNTISNGNFEEQDLSAWIGDDTYKSYGNAYVGAEEAAPYDGVRAGKTKSGEGSLIQRFTLADNKQYRVSFYSKWSAAPSASTKAVIKKTYDDEVKSNDKPLSGTSGKHDIEQTTEWTETSYTIDTTALGGGEHTIAFWKGPAIAASFYLDKLVIKEMN